MEITHTELAAWIESGAAPTIVDVRSAREYNAGHLPGAMSINVRELEQRIDEIKALKSSSLVVYCEHGTRSKKAAAILQKVGFESVLHLEGDITEWRRNNLPIERGDVSRAAS